MNPKIELIRRMPLFEGCSKRELAAVASVADEVDLPAGRALTREGETGHEFVVLAEGIADVVRDGRTVATLGPGDFLGEISLVTGGGRTATVVTRSPSRLLVLSEPAFRSVLNRWPLVRAKVLEAAVARLAA